MKMGVSGKKILTGTFNGKNFENLFTVTLVLAFILVTVTGILSFVRLNRIIYVVDEAIHPNHDLDRVDQIYDDLLRADNYVKSYNLTRNADDLKHFNDLADIAGGKMEALRAIVKNDPQLAPFSDTLKTLVKDKIYNLNILIGIKMKPDSVMDEGTRQAEELAWVRNDKIIMDRMRKLISDLDLAESKRMKEGTYSAELEAAELKTIIATFGIGSLLLIFLAGIAIYIYSRRNSEYRLAMRDARNKAEELARAKQQFLANMSHEIKTPMNVISGYISQILQHPLENSQREQMEIVKKSSDHLLELLNNLLDLSRLQANKLELIQTGFSPAAMVRDMHQWLTPSAQEKGLEFNVVIDQGIPPLISGDPVRLRQILFNLAGNAIKFTDHGSVSMIVRAGHDLNDRQTIVFEVSDTGPGIPEEEKDTIFSEFRQGNLLSSSRPEGAGLGLAITSRLVELMDGVISMKSTPGAGSVFTVEIPFLPTTDEDAVPQAKVEPDTRKLSGLNILIVDDEPYNRGLLKLILRKYQCEILEAQSGEEAVKLASSKVLDLILIDIHMPGMTGTEAAFEIRRNLTNPAGIVPIIALSAAVTSEEEDELRMSGIDAYIEKPFDEGRLINTINGLLGKSNKPEKLEAVFSLDPLRASCAGDLAFFREMVQTFLKDTSEGLNEMQDLLSKGETAALPELAHKLGSPCRHLKADRLSYLLKEIETNTGKLRSDELADLINQAMEEFGKIKKGMLEEPEFKS